MPIMMVTLFSCLNKNRFPPNKHTSGSCVWRQKDNNNKIKRDLNHSLKRMGVKKLGCDLWTFGLVKAKNKWVEFLNYPELSRSYRFLLDDIFFASLDLYLEKWWRMTSQMIIMKIVGMMKVVTEDHQTHSSCRKLVLSVSLAPTCKPSPNCQSSLISIASLGQGYYCICVRGVCLSVCVC